MLAMSPQMSAMFHTPQFQRLSPSLGTMYGLVLRRVPLFYIPRSGHSSTLWCGHFSPKAINDPYSSEVLHAAIAPRSPLATTPKHLAPLTIFLSTAFLPVPLQQLGCLAPVNWLQIPGTPGSPYLLVLLIASDSSETSVSP